MQTAVESIAGKGLGLVALEPIPKGSTVLVERPVLRANCAPHLSALRVELAMMIEMGYIPDFWAHALKDRARRGMRAPSLPIWSEVPSTT